MVLSAFEMPSVQSGLSLYEPASHTTWNTRVRAVGSGIGTIMPLVPVETKSALEFVRGSHRWTNRFRQTNFGAMTGDKRDQVSFGEDLEPFPDVEGNREGFDRISWDMEPGDLAILNSRIIHGGSGNLAPDRDLQVFNTQWLGDDVRVIFRPEGMDPDHSLVMREVGLQPGDRIGTDLYLEA